VFYDESGAIGRRYRRQDEVGTPFCITVDGETIATDTVTIRGRDDLAQVRVPTKRVGEAITALIKADVADARIKDIKDRLPE
jgi:glycyl-tRNA synthetase